MFVGVRGVWAALWCVLVLAARVDATSRGSLAPVTHRRLADDESAKATGGDAKGSWSEWRYRSNEELASAMDALHAGPCAGISKLTTIGTSVRGVEMRAMEVSTQPGVEQTKPGIMLVGNMHGDEPVGRELILRFARLLCIAHERRQRSAGGDDAGERGSSSRRIRRTRPPRIARRSRRRRGTSEGVPRADDEPRRLQR